MHIAANSFFHEQAERIDIDSLRPWKYQQEFIKAFHISYKDQIADIVTKPLGFYQMSTLVGKMGMWIYIFHHEEPLNNIALYLIFHQFHFDQPR